MLYRGFIYVLPKLTGYFKTVLQIICNYVSCCSNSKYNWSVIFILLIWWYSPVSICIFTFTICWLMVLLSYSPKPSQSTDGLVPHPDTLPKIKIHAMFYCDCPWGNGNSHRHCCVDFMRITLLLWLLISIKVLYMLITWRHRRCWVLIIKRKNLINHNYIY